MRNHTPKADRALTGRYVRAGRERITVLLDDRVLWTILLPIADNDGRVFLNQHHKKFLDRVLKISGGWTEHPWSTGRWIDDGRLYSERMIPLEFLATTEQADKITAFACVRYDQVEITCLPLTDRVRRYRRVQSSSQRFDVVQGTLTNQLPHMCEENPCACEQLRRSSVTSSGEPSPAQGLPPISEAARPLSEGASSPESIHTRRMR